MQVHKYTKKQPQPAQMEQFNSSEYLWTLAASLPQMSHLMKRGAAGQNLDIVSVIEVITELVAFYANSDKNEQSQLEKIFLMSQKKCRFCP